MLFDIIGQVPRKRCYIKILKPTQILILAFSKFGKKIVLRSTIQLAMLKNVGKVENIILGS